MKTFYAFTQRLKTHLCSTLDTRSDMEGAFCLYSVLLLSEFLKASEQDQQNCTSLLVARSQSWSVTELTVQLGFEQDACSPNENTVESKSAEFS